MYVLNNEVEIPCIGIGTYKLKGTSLQNIVKEAVNIGYNLIDTASVYDNEDEIGQSLKDIDSLNQKKNVFVTTKLAPAFHGESKTRFAASQSMKNLQRDCLDLYLIHWPGSKSLHSQNPQNVVMRKETWIEMEKLYLEKKIRAIGVSNYTIKHLEELLQYATIIPSVLQIEVHPYLIQEELREFCRKHHIHIQAYSSLGSQKGYIELMSDRTVIKIADEVNGTPAQVLLKWALQHGMSVIPKTSNVDRLRENFEATNIVLTNGQMRMLDSLNCGQRYCWDPNIVF